MRRVLAAVHGLAIGASRLYDDFAVYVELEPRRSSICQPFSLQIMAKIEYF